MPLQVLRFQVLTVARASSTDFLDMTPCSWVGRYQHFRGTRIRHPGRRVFTQHVSTNRCYQSTKQRRVDIPDGGNLSAIYFKGKISKVQSSATLLQARSFHFPVECLVSSACLNVPIVKLYLAYAIHCYLGVPLNSTRRRKLLIIVILGIRGAYTTQHCEIFYTADMCG